MRWIGCLVVGLVVALLPPAPSYAEPPPLTIRVAPFAQAGHVPPAIIGSSESLVGDPYWVSRRDEEGEPVIDGAPLQALPPTAPADPWSHVAQAPLKSLPAGRYTLTIEGQEPVPFEVMNNFYDSVITSLLGIYDSNADGDEPSSYHAKSHMNDRRSKIANGPHKGERVDVEGGWMDAGDQIKFTTTTAFSTLMLDLAARNESGQRPALRGKASIGIRWLLKAHPRKGVFVSLVGHVATDHNTGFRDPATDDESGVPLLRNRPTYVLTRSTGGSDVAGVAAAALATRAAMTGNKDAKARLLRHARAWLAFAEDVGKVWTNCCYQQDSFQDDLAIARAALWRATGRESYAAGALRALRRATTEDGEPAPWLVAADGYEMSAIAAGELCGVLGAKAAPKKYRDPACRLLRDGAGNWAYVVDTETAFGRAGWNQWGSARQHESGGLVLEMGLAAGHDVEDQALRAQGWFLGVNPWGKRFQVVYDDGASDVDPEDWVQHPYHWTVGLGLEPPNGAVPGGPTDLQTINDNRCDSCDPLALGTYDTAAQTYQDLADDWVMNEIGINYNAPAVLHFALLSGG